MKIVLKCDFCSETKETDQSELMETHEKECFANPEIKDCFTCEHNNTDHYDSMTTCNLKIDQDTNSEGGCDSHVAVDYDVKFKNRLKSKDSE